MLQVMVRSVELFFRYSNFLLILQMKMKKLVKGVVVTLRRMMMQHRRLGLVAMGVGGGTTSSALDTPESHAKTPLFYALHVRRNNLPHPFIPTVYTHVRPSRM